MGLAPGVRVGPYEVLGTLGAGGMGEVYRARDTRLGREVALKVLPAGVVGDPERLARFEQEARAVGALNHPNVLAIHDVGDHEGTPYIVTELLEGATLRERLAAGPLTPRKALDYASQVARGLAAAHDAGIIHRDLKPENLFVTKDGRVKILDFGLAKALGRTVSGEESTLAETEPGAVLGTAGYMAPEQVRGRPSDARADIFSLGAVLYEMLSGKRAFDGDSAIDRAHAILNREPPPLADSGATVPPAVERVMARCLEKSPDERFRSAADLGFALAALSDASGVGPRAVAAPPPRRSTVVVVIAALLIAFGVGGVLSGRAIERRGARRAVAPASQPVAARAPLATRMRRMTYQPGEEKWPFLAPDGTWFVYVRQVGGKEHILRQRVDGEKAIDLTPDSKDDNTHPAISPDGGRIAFRSSRDGGGIFIMGATGESPRRLTDFGDHPAWSPDGTTLALSTVLIETQFARNLESQLVLVGVATGERRPVKTVLEGSQAAWSADGRWLAFFDLGIQASGLPPALKAVAPGLPEASPVTLANQVSWTPAWAPDGRHVYFASNASGTANIWRVPWRPEGGPAGAAEPVTMGVGLNLQRPTLSRDGRLLLLQASQAVTNIARVRFDSRRGRVVGRPERLTRGPNSFALPDVSPDGKWVTFCSAYRAGSQEDIFVMRTDGTGLVRLTDDVASDRRPRFTADGRRIVWFSTRGGGFKSEIWSIAPDGSGLARIATAAMGELVAPIPSPIDTRLAVHVMFADGKSFIFDQSRPLEAQTPVPIAAFGQPGVRFLAMQWSRDGAKLVGVLIDGSGARRGIAAYDLASRRYQELWPDGWGQLLRDGRRLVVTGRDGTLTLVDTVAKRAATLLTLEHERISGQPSVSRDEAWIYFQVQSSDSDVWLAELR